MRAGKLRHQVIVQQATETNTAGNVTSTWATYITGWASIEPVSGSERFLSHQRFAEVSHTVTMRYRSGITPKMRILFGSRVFDIVSVLNIDERNRELRLLCTEDV